MCDRGRLIPEKGFKRVPWWSSGYVAGRGTPFQGSESGLLSDSLKRIVPGDTHAEKARDSVGKGHLGGEQGVRELRRTTLPRGSQSQVLMMELVPSLSLASHLSWPIFGLTQGLGGACVSARMDSSTKDLERIGRVYYGLASPSLWPLWNSSD